MFHLAVPPSLAVVILNWNGRAYLQQFLPSVLASTYANYRVVVADNASTDDSVPFLQQHFPQVQVIRMEKNHGFAQGYNVALQQVEADYFMLLNSDVEVQPGWLQPMVAVLEAGADRVACQPKILAWKQKDLFEYAGAAGGWLDAFGYPFARGRVFDICEADRGQYNDTQPVFWASGAALLIKSAAFREAGGFDPYFFAHQEEIDLCWRLQLMGKEIFCCPAAVVYHVGGGTLPRGNSKKTFLNFRNNQIMLWKNLQRREKWKIPVRLTLDQISGLKGLLAGDGGYFIAIIQAHLAFYGWLLLGPRTHRMKRKSMRQLKGVLNRNIAWLHFVKKKRLFSEMQEGRN